MSIVKLGPLVKTSGEHDEEGNLVTATEYYSDPTTGQPYYHVDSTELLDGLDEFRVTPEPGHHKFAGVQTYHYHFASADEWAEYDPRPSAVEDENPIP